MLGRVRCQGKCYTVELIKLLLSERRGSVVVSMSA